LLDEDLLFQRQLARRKMLRNLLDRNWVVYVHRRGERIVEYVAEEEIVLESPYDTAVTAAM